jgi:mycofactocin precursor
MSEQVATIEAAESPENAPGEAAAETTAEQPVVALQDLLVEEVSIDGMCGVY